MKFKVLTLADITRTDARRGEDTKAWRQQQNYNTFIGALGLRVNPIVEDAPSSKKRAVGNLGFGSDYTGRQMVWEFLFDTEYEGGLDLSMLEEDLDLIPFITDLDETAKIQPSVFRTTCKDKKNIIFMCVQND